MLIRPPVVRDMQRNLWAGMIGDPRYVAPGSDARHTTPESVTTDTLGQLRQLGELLEQGVLTEEEFKRLKDRVLAD